MSISCKVLQHIIELGALGSNPYHLENCWHHLLLLRVTIDLISTGFFCERIFRPTSCFWSLSVMHWVLVTLSALLFQPYIFVVNNWFSCQTNIIYILTLWKAFNSCTPAHITPFPPGPARSAAPAQRGAHTRPFSTRVRVALTPHSACRLALPDRAQGSATRGHGSSKNKYLIWSLNKRVHG